MSSRPEPPDLEGFIEDSFFLDRMPPGTLKRLVAFYEPHRERIEYAMNEDYDPETMSWRDWRNSYWQCCLPEPPLEEIKMSDEEIRTVERAALAGDHQARVRLTTLRLRRREGVVWVWVETPLRAPLVIDGPPAPIPVAVSPANTIELTLLGYATGGEAVIGGPQPPANPKRAWALACLNPEAAIFGREPVPSAQNLSGPHLLDLGSFKLVSLSSSERIFVDEARPLTN